MKFNSTITVLSVLVAAALAAPIPSAFIAERGVLVKGPSIDAHGLAHNGYIAPISGESRVAGASDARVAAQLERRGTLVQGPSIEADGTAHEGLIADIDGPDAVVGPVDHQRPPRPQRTYNKRGTLVQGPSVDEDGTPHEGLIADVDGPDAVVGAVNYQRPPRPQHAYNRRGTLIKGPVIDADGTVHPGYTKHIDGPDKVEAAEDHQTAPSTAAPTDAGSDAPKQQHYLIKGPVIDEDGTVHEGSITPIDGDKDVVQGAEDKRNGSSTPLKASKKVQTPDAPDAPSAPTPPKAPAPSATRKGPNYGPTASDVTIVA